MSKVRTVFVTFGDGSIDFIEASLRLTEQAQKLKMFERVVCLDSIKLSKLIPEYSDFISYATSDSERVFYFRYAKAFAIKSVLVGNHGECDQVIYLDAGCEIINNPIARLRLRKVLRNAFRCPLGSAQEVPYIEEHFTKSAALLALNASTAMRKSLQIQDGVVIINRNTLGIDFINEWISFSDPLLNLWQDPVMPEDDLIAHRHDQSIFSILWKRNRGEISNFYWNTSRGVSPFFDALTCTYAIQAIRNRTGLSIISEFFSTSPLSMVIGLAFLPISRIRRIYLNHKLIHQIEKV